MDITGVIFELKAEIPAEEEFLTAVSEYNFLTPLLIKRVGYEYKIEKLYNFADREGLSQSGLSEKNVSEAESQLAELRKKVNRTYKAKTLTEEAINSLYNYLKTNEWVVYVQYDEMNKLHALPPNDPYFSSQWGLHKIGCEDAWVLSEGDDIVVAVIDSGVDYNHPDLKMNMWNGNPEYPKHGKNFSEDNDDPFDKEGHGTRCAGIIAARRNNGIGVAGVAPKAKIMALKIFPNAIDSVCAAAIYFAADHGARVLSNSWGPEKIRPHNTAVENAIKYAFESKCIVVFAAGNENDDVSNYAPANNHQHVIAVAATTDNDNRWFEADQGSNYGSLISAAAPGVDIWSTTIQNQYFKTKGTSTACPHVSGFVALLLKIKNTLSLDEVKAIIRLHGNDVFSSTSKPVGAKRINAGESVTALATSLLSAAKVAEVKDTNSNGKANLVEETEVTITINSRTRKYIQD